MVLAGLAENPIRGRNVLCALAPTRPCLKAPSPAGRPYSQRCDSFAEGWLNRFEGRINVHELAKVYAKAVGSPIMVVPATRSALQTGRSVGSVQGPCRLLVQK